MRHRRSTARLAWALPLIVAVGGVAVSSDANFIAPPLLAQQVSTTSSETAKSVATLATSPATTVVETMTIELASEPPSTVAMTTTTAAMPSPPSSAVPTNEYVLEIPSIALEQPVVVGDQRQLDQGHVTAVDWSAYGYPVSCPPNEGCTVWLAGHRSTHGAVFARLPEIAIGATVTIAFQGQVYDYTVTEIAKVPGSAPPSVIRGDLVLQTSLPGDRRILVYATADGSISR